MRNHRRSSSSIRSSPTHGMDLKTHPGDGTKGNGNGPGSHASDHHRFSPGPDMTMLQKSYMHRENNSGVAEDMMSFGGGPVAGTGGYDMTGTNNLDPSGCNNDNNLPPNRIHPFGPFVPTPPGSGTNSSQTQNNNNNNNNGSPFCAHTGGGGVSAAAAAVAAAQLNNSHAGAGAPPSFMDTPPSSFCSAPYNYSLYSMHSQDSRVKLEKEKEAAAAAAAAVASYTNKHVAIAEDKELAAAKWITS